MTDEKQPKVWQVLLIPGLILAFIGSLGVLSGLEPTPDHHLWRLLPLGCFAGACMLAGYLGDPFTSLAMGLIIGSILLGLFMALGLVEGFQEFHYLGIASALLLVTTLSARTRRYYRAQKQEG